MAKILAFNTETNEWEYTSSTIAEFDNEIELTQKGGGIILTAPNGNRYNVSIDNTGTLVITAL